MTNDSLKNPESDIDREMASLIQQSIAPNTLKAYQHALNRFHAWLHANGFQPDCLADEIVAKYIAALYADGKAPATIAIVVAARTKHVKQVASLAQAGIKRCRR